MKTVLAFGDSLTWGADPGRGRRLPWAERWVTILEEGLNRRMTVRVIPEGLPGRTTCRDDGGADVDRNGLRWLPICLE